MSLICQHLHSSCMSLLYDSPQIRTDSIIGRVIYKNRHRIRILIHSLLHLADFHAKGNAQLRIHLRIYINRNCTAQYQGIDGTFSTFRGRMILSPALQTDRIMLCTADVVPPTIRNACAAPKASAASSSASLITETGWQRLSSGFIELTSSPTHFSPRSCASSGFPLPLFMSRHIKGNDSLLSETFQCFIYGRMLLSFIIHLTCSSFPVVMYRQIQFNHTAIVYWLKTGTMIQLFLYIFKSNACETRHTIL